MRSRQLWVGISIGVGAMLALALLLGVLVTVFVMKPGVGPLPSLGGHALPTDTPTLQPVPLPPQNTPTPATGAWTKTSDQSTGYVFDVNSANWTWQWACLPEHDPHGTLSVMFKWGDGQVLGDTGLQACDGTTRSFTLSFAGTVSVDLCEDADYLTPTVPTPITQPPGPETNNCQEGAVRWTMNSPNPPEY